MIDFLRKWRKGRAGRAAARADYRDGCDLGDHAVTRRPRPEPEALVTDTLRALDALEVCAQGWRSEGNLYLVLLIRHVGEVVAHEIARKKS